MTEQEWLAGDSHHRLFTHLRGRTTDRKVRLWAVACCRRNPHWCYDDEARRLVMVAEEFADGVVDRRALSATGLTSGVSLAQMATTVPGGAFVSRVARAADQVGHEVATQGGVDSSMPSYAERIATQRRAMADLVRDIFGNPFCPVAFSPEWRTSTAVLLAQQMYESRDFSAMPILADALQDAGCENADILDHCRDEKGTHVRGCWVVDLVLNKS